MYRVTIAEKASVRLDTAPIWIMLSTEKPEWRAFVPLITL